MGNNSFWFWWFTFFGLVYFFGGAILIGLFWDDPVNMGRLSTILTLAGLSIAVLSLAGVYNIKKHKN